MWFGLLYGICDDAAADERDERAMVILYAWERGRDRPMSVGCPLGAVPDMARLLREAATGAPLLKPRCDACGTTLDLPLE